MAEESEENEVKEEVSQEDIEDILADAASDSASPADSDEDEMEASPSGTSDVLSQQDVESLLAEVAEESSKTKVVANKGKVFDADTNTITPFDFRQPSFLTPLELRKVRLRHEQFIRSLAARFSIFLRKEFALQMAKLETVPHQKILESFGNPSHLVLFKVEPLQGISILELPPRLALTIVERLLGGPAHSAEATSDLSNVDFALLEEATKILLVEWCNHWPYPEDLRPVILGYESNPRFIETAPQDTVMLLLSLEASFGDCIEHINLAVPYYTLEPLVGSLESFESEKETQDAMEAANQTPWRSGFNHLPVNLQSRCQGPVLTVKELQQLQVGQVLPLDPSFAQNAQILISGVPKYMGTLGRQNDHWAVAIESRIDLEETNEDNS